MKSHWLATCSQLQMSARFALLLAAALAASATAASEPAERKALAFSTEVRITVNPDGQVGEVMADPLLAPAISRVISANVSQWRFSAPIKDGRAVSGVTYVRVGACAVPEATGSDYRFAVAYQGHGPSRQGEHLGFPYEMRRAGRSAELRVSYHIDPDGAARLDDIELTSGQKKYMPALRRTVTDWLAANRFRPEIVDGVPVTTKMVMPVTFRTEPGSRTFSSMAAARKDAEARAQAAVLESAVCQAATAGQTSRDVALDSPFRWQPRG